jgi:hypothetical protein
MTTSRISNDLPIGTPCLAWIDSFMLSDDVIDRYDENLAGNTQIFESNISVPELFNLDIGPWVVTDIVNKTLSKLHIVCLFPPNIMTQHNTEYFYHCVSPKNESILLLPTIPLVYDNGAVLPIENPEEIFKDTSACTKLLLHNRYATYILGPVSQSDTLTVERMIDRLMGNLTNEYPYAVAYRFAPLRSLFDTVVISFYRIEDMIAVFDRSKKGIGVEIYFTSSAWMTEEIIDKSCVFRFLFSKSKENLFTIDGEKIKRSSDMSVLTSVEIIKRDIIPHLPYKLDTMSTQPKTKKIKYKPNSNLKEKKICAELVD